MKKLIVLTLCCFLFIGLSGNSFAQKYVTFTSKTFSVYLKCSADYKEVSEISFSEDGKWVAYKVLKTLPLENKSESGNRYVVEDKKKNKYTVEYVVGQNTLGVLNQKTKIKTILEKKK